ncbi:MAG: cytochrome c peroxidase, partial [Pseudomonadota bacterium]
PLVSVLHNFSPSRENAVTDPFSVVSLPAATKDGLSLGLGDGGVGLGPKRIADPANAPEQRIPRNATALFNLGYPEFQVMFHDGRLETQEDAPQGLRTPIGASLLTEGLSPLATQTMFPVLSADEMAGHYSENEIAQAVRRGLLSGDGGAWSLLSERIAAIPEYGEHFSAAFGDDEVDFTRVARALASFIAFEWRADDSPFDRNICSGEPLEPKAADGMALFYGKAGCVACHSGRFQTDHGFHAIAMPQIGPGKAARFESHSRDTGRMRVTGRAEDAYRFRTPSLRNVALSAPYGHAGAYATLEAAVRHHLDPVNSLLSYDRSQVVMPAFGSTDFAVLDDPEELARIAEANELAPRELGEAEIDALVAFLEALTDDVARLGAPEAVPSGLKMK